MLMSSPADIRQFTKAGKAKLTLTSKKTGTSFTYRVKATDTPDRFFVSLLTGPDNESSFSYIGLMDCGWFRTTAKSKASPDAPSVKAFRFFCREVLQSGTIPEALEVRHEGCCGRCGRALTDPESIDRGIGPECANKLGID
jgi:hypothetical protein